jgi:cytochrome c oxidase cbb3-type subunit I/II
MSEHNESQKGYGRLHRRIFEGRAAIFAIGTTIVISIGGLVEIVPMYTAESLTWQRADWVTPYTSLEVAGRDIYIREGCYLCHSQMVRPMRAEILRYGEWSRSAEYQYDRPFLLGSRRLGPDLQREGGKYPDAWHYEHMRDPRSTSPGSIMPTYGWLLRDKVDPEDITHSMRALQRAGTPYMGVTEPNVAAAMQAQGEVIVQSLATAGITAAWDDEIVALIAYIQRLGADGKRHFAQMQKAGAGGGGSAGAQAAAAAPTNPHSAPANPHVAAPGGGR